MSSTDVSKRALFGGAIECSLPSAFVSVSDIRQIPSNQEVFVHKDWVNTSFIIEILEPVDLLISVKQPPGEKGTKDEEKDPETGASFEEEAMNNMAVIHFEEIAAANDAQSYDVDTKSLKLSTNTNNKGFAFQTASVKGTQQVFKFGQADHLDTVRMWVGVIRVDKFDADVVMSLNSSSSSSLPGEAVSEAELDKMFAACFESVNVINFAALVAE